MDSPETDRLNSDGGSGCDSDCDTDSDSGGTATHLVGDCSGRSSGRRRPFHVDGDFVAVAVVVLGAFAVRKA